MIEVADAGSTVKIRVLMMDGATAKTGLSVNVSIERASDGKYWNHSTSSWEAAYQANAMTELTGDAHKNGMYEYAFATPQAAGIFDWRVTYDGVIKRAFAGRISTEGFGLQTAIAELTGVPAATPTIKQALMLLYMHLRNMTTSGGSSPNEQLKIRNAAGTVIAKADEDYDGTTFTKAQLQNGP